MRQEAIILIPVPSRNPKKEPNAALKDPPTLFPAKMSSATKAPSKGPNMIPIGGTNIPTIKPMTAPQPAYLLPPVSLVK